MSELTLTSLAVTATDDGFYPFQIKCLLIPHEALRREMIRGLQAADCFDPAVHPWKAYCFNEWLNKFFIPTVQDHHDIEEKIFFPFYLELGVPTPPKQSADHKVILEKIRSLLELSNTILTLVQSNGDNSILINEKSNEFKELFHQWYHIMDQHLADEELYWPEFIEKFGEKAYLNLEKKIVSEGVKHGGSVFENFCAAIVYSIGVEVGGIPLDENDKGWANSSLQKEFLSSMPTFPVRMILLPKWNKRFQRFRIMINSVKSNVDVLHLQDIPPTGCSCIIA